MALSELHIALIGAGVAGVLMVWGYNLWQDRKHRKTAERIFSGGAGDAMEAAPAPAPELAPAAERHEPTLGVEAGYAWGGKAMWALEYISDANLRTALSDLNVGFVSARAGFELGSKNLALTVQVGASYLDASLGAQSLDLGNGVSFQATGSRLKGFVPSARVGFLICFG